jgi:hypothetical protein
LKGEEFSDLAALWCAPAPPAERSELEQLARRTPGRARLVLVAEIAFAAIIALCIAAAMVWRLGPATLLTGSLILLLLGWSAWSRHRLGSLAMLADRSDRLAFVGSLVRAKEAELRRSAIGLALILPGTMLATMLSFQVQVGDAQLSFAEFIPQVMLTLRGILALALLGSAITLLTLAHLRLIGELTRLHALAREYAEEARLERSTGG